MVEYEMWAVPVEVASHHMPRVLEDVPQFTYLTRDDLSSIVNGTSPLFYARVHGDGSLITFCESHTYKHRDDIIVAGNPHVMSFELIEVLPAPPDQYALWPERTATA